MTLLDRYHQLAAQRAYAARIAAFGLPALLAPYAVKPAHMVGVVPAQRVPGVSVTA